MSLGDAWGREDQPTADQSSVFSMDYYRAKAREYQEVLTGLDSAYRAAVAAIDTGGLAPPTVSDLHQWLSDYEDKRTILRTTAEALNAGAAAINAAGGRFPVLSIPRTLGLPPIAGGAALVATIGVVAALISWGRDAILGLNERLKRAQLIESATVEQRDAIIRAIADSDSSVQLAESSTLATIAPIVKWGAIALAAFLAYRVWQGTR